MTEVRAHVTVSGRVQGVSFRATTRHVAKKHEVNGWVRNLDDGRVEAVFEGEETAVNALIDFCHDGPSRARVDDVVVNWEEPQGFDEFAVQR